MISNNIDADVLKYQIAIETVTWLAGELTAEHLIKFPATAEKLNTLRERLNFIFDIRDKAS